jgi:hypothetical protein
MIMTHGINVTKHNITTLITCAIALNTMALNVMTHRLIGLIRTLSINVTKEKTKENLYYRCHE